MITFEDVGNYRGDLQVKQEDCRYYWRVDCDVEEELWMEIPEYLYSALVKFDIE